jgi:hypothetical protein
LKTRWKIDELIEFFTLRSEEYQLLSGDSSTSQLGLAALLKFFEYEGRFPRYAGEVPADVIQYLAQQLGVDAALYQAYRWDSSPIKKHRRMIRRHFEFRRATTQEKRKLQVWLYEKVVANEQNVERLRDMALQRLREHHVEPPQPLTN